MTPERWQRIEKLYHDALEMEAEARSAFLDATCAGDDGLRREIQALLAANDQPSGLLDGHALSVEAKALAAENVPTSLQIPALQDFSHYRILSKLGAGGMGEVFLARDERLGRRVAIKILPPHFTADPSRLQRFAREAKAASALNHPSILTIHEIGQVQTASGELHFITTEYVEGVTLRARLAQMPLTLGETLDVAIQIAAALDAAHKAGIIHRDIKPENLMLRPDGLVKVLDFGLAKLTDARSFTDREGDLTSTAQGMLLGTPRYMSPEQARGQKVDSRSDLFSLGSVLYEMLTGRTPFQGESVADLFAEILQKDPPPLSRFVAQAPDNQSFVEIQRIVRRTLAKDCANRYQSAREVQLDLQSLRQCSSAETLAQQPINVGKLEDAVTTSQPGKVVTSKFSSWTDSLANILTLSAPGRSLSVAGILFATVLLIVAGLTVWLIWRPGKNAVSSARELKFEMLYSKAGQDNVLLPQSHFSPDGEMIAFAAGGDGNNIWVRQIGGDRDSQITFGKWDDNSPLWAYSGKKIAFISNRNNELGIWTTLSLGSTPVLLKTLGGSETISTRGTLQLLAWTKDESAIFYEWGGVPFRLNLKTKESLPLLPANPPFQLPEGFAISPDEQQVAFVAQTSGQASGQETWQFDLWTMDLRNRTPRRLINDPHLDQTPLWISEDKLLYNSSRNDRLQIFLADLSGGEPTLISTSDHQCRLTDYSAKTNRLLCYEQRDESNIFAVETDTGHERQMTDDLGPEFWPTVSPDSKTLLYQVIQGDRLAWDPRRSLLFTKPALTKGQSARFVTNAFEAQWAPNGEQVGFLRLAGTVAQLWRIKSAGGDENALVTDNVIFGGQRNGPPYNRVHARAWHWSPDGNRIVYAARSNGVADVWTIAADGTDKKRISANNDSTLRFDCPTWSPDGRHLAYLSEPSRKPAGGKQLASLWVGVGQQPAMIFQTEAVLRLLGWLSNEELLIALADRVDGATSQPTTIRLFRLAVASLNSQAVPMPFGSLAETYLSSVRLAMTARSLAFVKMLNGRTDLWLATVGSNRMTQERKLTSNSDPSSYFSSPAWSPDGKTIYYDRQTRWSLLTMADEIN